MAEIINETLLVGQSTEGKHLSVEAIKFIGTNSDAPKVYIQAGIHGAELQGSLVIHKLIDYLQKNPPLGDISLVPQANPIGCNHKVGDFTQGRFDAMNGDNWNRYYHYDDRDIDIFLKTVPMNLSQCDLLNHFRRMLKKRLTDKLNAPLGLSRAARLDLSLQRIAVDADIVLDLHTDAHAINYVFSPQYAQQTAAQCFETDILLSLPNQFAGAMDEAIFCPWWTLWQKYHQQEAAPPIEAFTLELGNHESLNDQQAKQQMQGICRYLAAKKVIATTDFTTPTVSSTTIWPINQFQVFYAPVGGLYQWLCSPGDAIKESQIIAHCLQSSNKRSLPIVAPTDMTVVNLFSSAAVPQGTALAKVLIGKPYASQ
ncbi:MAG: succinylglutamate desuccinylase/aspartoacylase family protein [Pseudomonadota bacterium]